MPCRSGTQTSFCLLAGENLWPTTIMLRAGILAGWPPVRLWPDLAWCPCLPLLRTCVVTGSCVCRYSSLSTSLPLPPSLPPLFCLLLVVSYTHNITNLISSAVTFTGFCWLNLDIFGLVARVFHKNICSPPQPGRLIFIAGAYASYIIIMFEYDTVIP